MNRNAKVDSIDSMERAENRLHISVNGTNLFTKLLRMTLVSWCFTSKSMSKISGKTKRNNSVVEKEKKNEKHTVAKFGLVAVINISVVFTKYTSHIIVYR